MGVGAGVNGTGVGLGRGVGRKYFSPLAKVGKAEAPLKAGGRRSSVSYVTLKVR